MTLDDKGASALMYKTPPPNTEGSCGSSGPGTSQANAEITVSRPGVAHLKDLATSLLTNGLGTAGSVVGPIVASVLDPVLSSVLGQLENLTQVTGTAKVVIKEPTTSPCTTTTPTTTPTTLPSRTLPEPGSCEKYLNASDFVGADGKIYQANGTCNYLGMSDSGISAGSWAITYFPDQTGAESGLATDVKENPGSFDFRAISGVGDEAYSGCNATGCETLARDVNLLISVGANQTDTVKLAGEIVSELGS